MRAFRTSFLIALSGTALAASAVAQTSPPPDYQQPPPGYQQQPPPGYQQQPPPGYQQPPPGYQQQPPPGYQQQPPPGYQQQPPPGYYQQPPTAYQQPPGYAPPPPPPPGRHGFLAMPFIGIASHQGSEGDGLGPGFVIGGLLGGRVGPNFSINGELRFDVLNPKNVGSGVDVTALELDFALSPLFHMPFPNGEFILGPKLGVYALDYQVRYGGVDGGSSSASGFVYGFNSGVFFDVGPHSALGGLLTFAVRDPSTACSTPAGGSESCISGDYVAAKVLGFQFAALF